MYCSNQATGKTKLYEGQRPYFYINMGTVPIFYKFD